MDGGGREEGEPKNFYWAFRELLQNVFGLVVGRFRYGSTVYTQFFFSFLQKLFGHFIAYFCNVSEFTTRFNFEKGIPMHYLHGIEYFLLFIMITFTYG